MKKNILISIALIMSLGVSAKRYPSIEINHLPIEAQNFILHNFGASSIKKVKESSNKYEVKLDDGTKIQFFKNGSLKQAEAGKHYSLPISVLNVLPRNVKAYVMQNFGKWRLIEVEVKNSGKIEIELEKGKYDAELEFNHAGQLIKVDVDD